jgi:hypothetical protein
MSVVANLMPTKSIKRQASFNPRRVPEGAARMSALLPFLGDPILLRAPEETQRSLATVNSRRGPPQPRDNRRVGVATFEQRKELRVVLRAPRLA